MRIRSLAVLASCALALTGCVIGPNPASPAATIPHDTPSGGQTTGELTATLEGWEGITLEEVGCADPNVHGNTGCSVRLRLDDGYRIADRVAFVDFLVTSMWSLRDGYQPNTSLGVALFGDPADPFSLQDVLAEAGWAPTTDEPGTPMAENGFTSAEAWLTTDAMPDAGGAENLVGLGAWPGDAPTLPVDAVAPVTP